MTNEELKGVLFPNTKTSEKQPDLRGSVKVNGVEYDVAGWKRVAKSGIPFISLMLQTKEERKKYVKTPTPKENVDQVSKAVGGRTEFKQGTIVDEDPLPF